MAPSRGGSRRRWRRTSLRTDADTAAHRSRSHRRRRRGETEFVAVAGVLPESLARGRCTHLWRNSHRRSLGCHRWSLHVWFFVRKVYVGLFTRCTVFRLQGVSFFCLQTVGLGFYCSQIVGLLFFFIRCRFFVRNVYVFLFTVNFFVRNVYVFCLKVYVLFHTVKAYIFFVRCTFLLARCTIFVRKVYAIFCSQGVSFLLLFAGTSAIVL